MKQNKNMISPTNQEKTPSGAFFALVLITFILSNILNIRGSIFISVPVTIISILLLFCKQKKNSVLLYVLIISILGIREIIFTSIIYIFYLFINIGANLKIRHEEIVFVITFIFMMLISISVGGNFNYNIAKFISLYSPIAVLLLLRRWKLEKAGIPYLFIACASIIIVSIISKYLHFPYERNSIFNGSENIGFFIVSALVILFSAFEKRHFFQISIYVLYLVYVGSTGSRTAFISSFMVLLMIVSRKIGWTSSALALSVAACISLFLTEEVAVFSLIRSQIEVFFDNAGRDGLLFSLSLIDVRGDLFAEAIELIWKSPVFGNGSVPPSIYDVEIYGVQAFHNTILDLTVTYGFVGLSIYVLIFSIAMSKIFKENKYYFFLMIFLFLFVGFFQPIVFNIQAMTIFFLSISLLENGIGRDKLSSGVEKNVA